MMVNDKAKKFDGDSPCGYFFIGDIFLGLSVFLYFYFTDFEDQGSSRRINWVVALLYDIGGKWTVIGVVLVMVLFCVSLAIREFKRRQSWK
jgi:hypothetical protein